MASLNSSILATDSVRTLPLINPSTVFHYTFSDLLKPGPQDVLQSTLPFYHVIIYATCLILWIVFLVYFSKFVYYDVNDPYATPLGSAPPWEKRSASLTRNANNILDYINYFNEKMNVWRE